MNNQRKKLDYQARNRLSNYNDHTYQKIRENKNSYIKVYHEDSEWFHHNKKYISLKYFNEFLKIQDTVKEQNINVILISQLHFIHKKIDLDSDIFEIHEEVETYTRWLFGNYMLLTDEEKIFYKLNLDHICSRISRLPEAKTKEYIEYLNKKV